MWQPIGADDRLARPAAHGGRRKAEPTPAEPTAHRRPPNRRGRAGTVIGPYKLLEQIGEGGMGDGLDGRADRAGPAARWRLKLIKPGMDYAAGARPLRGRAAGAGADGPPQHRQGLRRRAPPRRGRPYFVMELVKGVPITKYCDERQPDAAASGWNCSSRSARRSSTPTRRASSTATSSRRTFWSALYDGRPVPEGDRLRRGQGDRRSS